ncbi:MAG: hypothetical protein JST89_16565 [Cyanobacteria bacterium SZAS-4]|nr:hypothetical protein [Cyanobacteria bacterium SZAS-4]
MTNFWRTVQKNYFQHALSRTLLALIVCLPYQLGCALQTSAQETSSSFSQQFTKNTKEILQSGIEIERFSLHFRMESAKQPRFRRLRYFLSQEAASAGLLAFEVTGVDQFGVGRKRPLKLDPRPLRGSLAAATTTSIIASSGSMFELSSNVVQMLKNKKHGYDPKSANKYIASKLRHIDELLAQRDALLAANTNDPSYARVAAEGKILHDLRSSFVNEYSHFNADTSAYRTYQNMFYLLNASYNAIGALGANTAYRALARPHLNGTANVLFIVAGSMATVTPIISQAAGYYARRHAYTTLKKDVGASDFSPDQFAADLKNLETVSGGTEGSLIQSLPLTQRVAIYTQSNELFTKQLDSETKTMRKLEKVALQTSTLGPAIGATLLTQGILGTYGYYHYPIQPRKQINQYYCGAIVGTVGAGAAVIGNAASLLAGYSYEHKLSKQKKLPVQLIQQRLAHLDEIEKQVQTLQ